MNTRRSRRNGIVSRFVRLLFTFIRAASIKFCDFDLFLSFFLKLSSSFCCRCLICKHVFLEIKSLHSQTTNYTNILLPIPSSASDTFPFPLSLSFDLIASSISVLLAVEHPADHRTISLQLCQYRILFVY